MSSIAQQTFTEETAKERRSLKALLNDSVAEVIVGGGAIVLSLIGLSNINPELMLPLAAIVMGIAFILEGEVVLARASKFFMKSADRLREEQPGVGVTAELIGGIAGLALGILALLGLYPLVLVPIAAIAYGSTLIFGSGLNARMSDLEIESYGEPVCIRRLVCEALASSSHVAFLLGLGAAILGITALTGVNALSLSLVALLIAGVGSLLDGASITFRMASVYRR